MTKKSGGRRPTSRNIDRKVELLAQAANPIALPDHLKFRDPREHAYFMRLIGYRAFDDWVAADFDRLKRASEIWLDIVINDELANDEEYIMVDAKGRPFANPRFALIDALQARHDAVLRGLQVNRAIGHSRTVANRRSDAAAAVAALSDDPLLARPRSAKPDLTLIKGD